MLLVIESTDVLFAVDSVPAIFGVTQDPFIVFTSNIFAILGLRALYFLLAGVMDMFRYLNYGLAAVLVFVGVKMVLEFWLGRPRWCHPAVSLVDHPVAVGDFDRGLDRRQAPPAAGDPPAETCRRADGLLTAAPAGMHCELWPISPRLERRTDSIVKHALITGGAGFIGSHLAEALIARDYRVTVVDDESTGTAENLAAVRDHFNFSFVHGSVADKALVRRLVSDVDEVYHLAAAVGVQLISTAPIHTIETNIYPTELMLSELLRRKREGYAVKLFLASSSEVYGKNPKPLWTEDDDLVFGPTTRPRWSYGASKAIDEFLALAYWRQHRLPVVIGRFFNVVGPRQTGRYGMVLPRFVEAALAGRPLTVHDDGQQVRCFAHVPTWCAR